METFRWVGLERSPNIELEACEVGAWETGPTATASARVDYRGTQSSPGSSSGHGTGGAAEAEANPATIEWLLTLAQAGPGIAPEPGAPGRRMLWPFGRTPSDRELTVRALLSAGIPASPNWPVTAPATSRDLLDDALELQAAHDPEGDAEPEVATGPEADSGLDDTGEVSGAELGAVEFGAIGLEASPPEAARLEATQPQAPQLEAPQLEAVAAAAGADADDAPSSTLLARVRAYATLGPDLPEQPSLPDLA